MRTSSGTFHAAELDGDTVRPVLVPEDKRSDLEFADDSLRAVRDMLSAYMRTADRLREERAELRQRIAALEAELKAQYDITDSLTSSNWQREKIIATREYDLASARRAASAWKRAAKRWRKWAWDDPGIFHRLNIGILERGRWKHFRKPNKERRP